MCVCECMCAWGRKGRKERQCGERGEFRRELREGQGAMRKRIGRGEKIERVNEERVKEERGKE